MGAFLTGFYNTYGFALAIAFEAVFHAAYVSTQFELIKYIGYAVGAQGAGAACDVKVKMGTGGVAGVAQGSYVLTGSDPIAFLDFDRVFQQVSIEGVVSVFMLDGDCVAAGIFEIAAGLILRLTVIAIDYAYYGAGSNSKDRLEETSGVFQFVHRCFCSVVVF